MDNFESQPAASPVDQIDLRDQVESLRQLVGSLLVLLLVISGTLNLYLLRQVKGTGADLKNIRPQVAQMINEYNKISGPAITKFVGQLTEFSKTHPDFAPVLNKYIRPQPGAPGAAATTAAPPPAPAPSKK
jgi:hypothetical protein